MVHNNTNVLASAVRISELIKDFTEAFANNGTNVSPSTIEMLATQAFKDENAALPMPPSHPPRSVDTSRSLSTLVSTAGRFNPSTSKIPIKTFLDKFEATYE